MTGTSSPTPEVPLLRSSVLGEIGIPHGFSTRQGGVSSPPFDSLNLAGGATPSGKQDEPENIWENLRRFAGSVAGLSDDALGNDGPRPLYRLARQVHGNMVCHVEAIPSSPYSAVTPTADAMVSSSPGQMLIIRTADCLPILLADSRRRAVAAIHAGWRGLVGGVIESTLETLAALGIEPNQLKAAIGPAISVRHFEVGPEVAEAFTEKLGDAAIIDRTFSAKPHVDLPGTAANVLKRAGANEENIDRVSGCTFAEPARFYSHRRAGGETGRLGAGIMLPV